MPKTKKAARPMRAAERMYGEALGSTRVSELEQTMGAWDDDELFVIAHLGYLQLQALDELRRQNKRIIALLEDIGGDTDKLADVAEVVEAQIPGEDEGDDEPSEDDDPDEVEDEDEPESEPPAPVEAVVVPAKATPRKRAKPTLLTHPVPDAPTPEDAA